MPDPPCVKISCKKCGTLLCVLEWAAYEDSGSIYLAPCKTCIGKLEEREAWLCALEAAGVDNWSGYEMAQELQEEWSE